MNSGVLFYLLSYHVIRIDNQRFCSGSTGQSLFAYLVMICLCAFFLIEITVVVLGWSQLFVED